jgi:hypothetical protein
MATLTAWKCPAQAFVKKEAFAIECHVRGLRWLFQGVLQ